MLLDRSIGKLGLSIAGGADHISHVFGLGRPGIYISKVITYLNDMAVPYKEVDGWTVARFQYPNWRCLRTNLCPLHVVKNEMPCLCFTVPIIAHQITKGGAADATGKLRLGDRILEVNNHNVRFANHQQAVQLLISQLGNIELLVQHVPQPPGLQVSCAAVRRNM